MKNSKILEITDSYEEWLIESLRNKDEAIIYIKVAIEEYQKDKDMKSLLLALTHFIKAQNKNFI